MVEVVPTSRMVFYFLLYVLKLSEVSLVPLAVLLERRDATWHNAPAIFKTPLSQTIVFLLRPPRFSEAAHALCTYILKKGGGRGFSWFKQ